MSVAYDGTPGAEASGPAASVIGVDGGQSGLRLRHLPSGRTGEGPGFSYHDGHGIVESVRLAAWAAQLDPAGSRGSSGRACAVDAACLGLSGVPADPTHQVALARALAAELGASVVRLSSDMVTAHAGALPEGVGVVVAAGTGVACLGVGADGRTHRVDGWGHLFGDAGSGFAIGRAGIEAVLRARDGRGPATVLSGRAAAHFDVPSGLLTHTLYRSATVVADVASFAPEVFEAARRGDRVAARIVAAAAEGLAETAASAVRAVSSGDAPSGRPVGGGPVGGGPVGGGPREGEGARAAGVEVPVAFVGKIFGAGEILVGALQARLAELAPNASVVPAKGDALDGATRLALDPAPAYDGLLTTVRAVPTRNAVATRDSARTTLPFRRGGLIVSCQARAGNPLRSTDAMLRMARAAVLGGAVGIRANGPEDIAAIAGVLEQPVIGLFKQGDRDGVYITPTLDAARSVVRAGARVVALDGTPRSRADGATLAEQIACVHDELGALVFADVDSLESGRAARNAGADLVSTTLAGYTPQSRERRGQAYDPIPARMPEPPDLELVAALAAELDIPVVAEGRYRTRAEVAAAFDAGAYAVVVGTAITDPIAITRALT